MYMHPYACTCIPNLQSPLSSTDPQLNLIKNGMPYLYKLPEDFLNAMQAIKDKFGLAPNQLRAYIHYHRSYYHYYYYYHISAWQQGRLIWLTMSLVSCPARVHP